MSNECAKESVIFGAVSVIDRHNDEMGNAISELEKRLGGILSAPEPAVKKESPQNPTSCSLEERLKQAGEKVLGHIDCLRNIINRLQI